MIQEVGRPHASPAQRPSGQTAKRPTMEGWPPRPHGGRGGRSGCRWSTDDPSEPAKVSPRMRPATVRPTQTSADRVVGKRFAKPAKAPREALRQPGERFTASPSIRQPLPLDPGQLLTATGALPGRTAHRCCHSTATASPSIRCRSTVRTAAVCPVVSVISLSILLASAYFASLHCHVCRRTNSRNRFAICLAYLAYGVAGYT